MQDIVQFLKALGRVSEDIKFSRGTFFLIIVFSFLSGLANTALLALIADSLSDIEAVGKTLALAFVALCILLPTFSALSQALLLRLGGKAIFSLRMNLSQRILAAPQRHLEDLGPDRLLASLTDDVDSVADTIMDIPQLIMQITIVLSCLAYLGWLSWPVLLGVVLVMVVALVSYQFPMSIALKHLKRFREEWDVVMKHLRALTQGSKELKLHRGRRQAFMSQMLEAAAASQVRHIVVGNTIIAIANNWGQILYFVVIGLVLFVLPDYRAVSPEVTTGYALVILYLKTPLESILNLLPNLSRGCVAMEKVEELGLSLRSHTTEVASTHLLEPPKDWKSLEFKSVVHTYEHQENVDDGFQVGPLDLRIGQGEIIFLIGGNGSGKTTLAKLLSGLYVPNHGEVLLNGEPVNDQNRDEQRQLFSVIFAEFYLFETLLGLNTPELDLQAQQYLAKLHLERKVKVEEGVLSTIDLSQGQRKRLALLTAYLEDRSIYLFDEWAADQDPVFKQIFYYQLLPELKKKGKTVIAISHDDRYYTVGDRVVKLSDGKLEYDLSMAEFRETIGTNPFSILTEEVVEREGLDSSNP